MFLNIPGLKYMFKNGFLRLFYEPNLRTFDNNQFVVLIFAGANFAMSH